LDAGKGVVDGVDKVDLMDGWTGWTLFPAQDKWLAAGKMRHTDRLGCCPAEFLFLGFG